jgi:hypothetical protein
MLYFEVYANWNPKDHFTHKKTGNCEASGFGDLFL